MLSKLHYIGVVGFRTQGSLCLLDNNKSQVFLNSSTKKSLAIHTHCDKIHINDGNKIRKQQG